MGELTLLFDTPPTSLAFGFGPLPPDKLGEEPKARHIL